MALSVTQVRIVNYVLAGTGLVTTAVRLYLRFRRRKLWWDDFWVLIAAISTIILLVANYYHIGPPPSMSQHSKVIYYWLCVQFYYVITWTSRLSILCTVIRIAAPGSRMKLFLKTSAVLFVVSWAILTAQVFWVCIPEPTWKQLALPQCFLGFDVAIAQVITYIGTDAILIYAPIQFIWGVRLPQATKIRLMAVFAATIVTTAASLYYIYAVLKINGLTEDFAATIHDGLSLIVANLSVITSFIFTLVSPSSSSEDPEAPHAWHAPRRTPVRSFPFLSTFKTMHESETTTAPTQVNLHVEVERDFQTKSVVPQSESETELGGEPFYGMHGEGRGIEGKKGGGGGGGGGGDVYELKGMVGSKV